MQRDPRFFAEKASPTYAFEVGDYALNTPVDAPYTYDVSAMPSLGAALAGKEHEFPRPPKGVELQPSETCPRNFVIFDHTDNKSRIMFHPTLAHKFSCPSAHGDKNDDNQENFSYVKEDTEDINALLSSEGEGEEDEDDDVVSTGRTPCNWGGSSSDSSCTSLDGQKYRRPKSASAQFPPGSSSERKRERTRKMVKALRGIIPGGDRMDTPAVLDEAVRYLKSLKVEAKKLGIQTINN